MLDTKGPEIRTGMLDPSCGGKLKFTKGELIEVGTDYARPCTPAYLACSYKSLPKSVGIGSRMLVADGALLLEVVELKSESVVARILNNASIGDRKNMNLPGAVVDLPTLTEKDIDDLVNFGIKHQVDFIAASFVRTGEDIDFIRRTLGPAGAHIKIIAKIENQQGLENYDEILRRTDGIMVARGDLGMEIPIEKVFLAQKMMIYKANAAGRPVVTATQMLESMITNPRPTRAECADVANAVLDGTDAVMLSGETANGEYPCEAVRMMASTCCEAEAMLDHDAAYTDLRRRVLAAARAVGAPISPPESLASSAVKTAFDTRAALIVVLSESGTTARLIAKYRPECAVLVLTPSAAVARQCAGYVKNCRCEVVGGGSSEEIVQRAVVAEVAAGRVSAGSAVVCVHGTEGAKAGSTSIVRVITA